MAICNYITSCISMFCLTFGKVAKIHNFMKCNFVGCKVAFPGLSQKETGLEGDQFII